MVRSFYNQTGVRQRATASVNGRNDTTLSWAAPSESTITGVRLQPLGSQGGQPAVEEIRSTRTGEVLTHRLLAPSGSDFLRADRWVQDGITYEVDGDGLEYLSPTGVAEHMEVKLRRVLG